MKIIENGMDTLEDNQASEHARFINYSTVNNVFSDYEKCSNTLGEVFSWNCRETERTLGLENNCKLKTIDEKPVGLAMIHR